MIRVEEGDRWFRRAYVGTADQRHPVIVAEVWEGTHPQSGRMDFLVRLEGDDKPMLAGSFLALYTQAMNDAQVRL